MERSQIISIDPKTMSGKPVFTGTRVPLRNFWDYMEAGDSMEVFLEHFPSVTREQCVTLLELANEGGLA